MIRSWFVCLKQIAFALLALVLLLCAAEVALRVHAAATGKLETSDSDERGLLTRCRQTHHRLKPFASFDYRNADTGATVSIATNSFGLRGPEPVVPKPPGLYRIVCLGDEATLAPDVPDDETFSARLQMLLQSRSHLQVEVVNAGVPGYCPLLSLLQLRHSLLALQPDLIVLNVDMSDVADDHRYRRHLRSHDGFVVACPHPDLKRSSPQGPVAIAESCMLTRWLLRQIGRLPSETKDEDLRDIDTPQGRYTWLRDDVPAEWSIYVEQALSPIEQLASLADGIGVPLVVAAGPAPWQVSAKASRGSGVRQANGIPREAVLRSRAPFDTLAGFCRERRLRFCDISRAFGQFGEPERLFLENAPRFSPLGHELYARQLASFVLQTVPGAWNSSPRNPQYAAPPPTARREHFPGLR